MKKVREIDNKFTTEVLLSFLSKNKPKRISKSHVGEIKKISPKYIRALKIIEKEHVAMFSNCLPSNY